MELAFDNVLCARECGVEFSGFYLWYNGEEKRADRAVAQCSIENVADIDFYMPISNSEIFLSKNSEANPFMVYHRYRMKVRKKWIIAEVKLYLDEGMTNVNKTVPTDETLGKYGMNRGNFEP